MLNSRSPPRCGQDDTPIACPLHMGNGGTSEMKRSINTDGQHAIPQRVIRRFKARENDEPRIVDQDVDAAKAGNGEFNDANRGDWIFQILVACGSDSACCHDFCNDGVRDRGVEAAAVLRYACIMDDDGAAASGKEPRIGSSKPPSRSGYDDDLAVKADGLLIGMCGHRGLP